jgi:hypothetical protein
MSYVAWIGGGAGAKAGGHGDAAPAGIYMGCHDPVGRLKMLPVAVVNTSTTSSSSSSGGGAGTGATGAGGELAVLRALHTHPMGFAAAGQPLVTAYPVVLQAFRGGWWDAAAIYRRWVLGENISATDSSSSSSTSSSTGSSTSTSPATAAAAARGGGAAWTRKGPLRGRAGYPPWVLNTPLWIVHGDDDKLGPAQAVQWAESFKTCLANGSALNGEKGVGWELGYHWYNWQTQAFDQDYPAMTPRPGSAASSPLGPPGTVLGGQEIFTVVNPHVRYSCIGPR